MIIGNGLIANTFQEYKDDKNVLIFASGVSNSREDRKNEFIREYELIKQVIEAHPQKKFIYFSTVSVFDNSLVASSYIKHKLKIESYIKNNCKYFSVFRLPIIISRSKNPNTLINFFTNNILSGVKFKVYRNACRYFLSINDVLAICSYMINNYQDNFIKNIVIDNRISVQELVVILERILNKKALYELVDKGDCYFIENSVNKTLLNDIGIKQKDYIYSWLNHYYKSV